MRTRHAIGSPKNLDFGATEVNESSTRPWTYSPGNYRRSDIIFRMPGRLYSSLSYGYLKQRFWKFGIGAHPGFAGVLLYSKVRVPQLKGAIAECDDRFTVGREKWDRTSSVGLELSDKRVTGRRLLPEINLSSGSRACEEMTIGGKGHLRAMIPTGARHVQRGCSGILSAPYQKLVRGYR